MSEDMGVNEGNEQAQPEDKVVLVVKFSKDGTMKVDSSLIQDKLAIYGVLEAVRDMVQEAHKPKIQPVTNGGFRKFLNGHGR